MSVITSPILLRLLRAIYWFDEALRAAQEAAGMAPVSRAQALLLINIALGEHRPVRLARSLGVTKQAVSLMLAELNAAGRLAITPDPDDARASLVDFSEEGREELQFIFSALKELEDHLATVIGDDRMAVLRAALAMDWGEPPVVSPPHGAILPVQDESARMGKRRKKSRPS